MRIYSDFLFFRFMIMNTPWRLQENWEIVSVLDVVQPLTPLPLQQRLVKWQTENSDKLTLNLLNMLPWAISNVLNFKVWQTRFHGLILNFYPSAEVVNDVGKGADLRICLKHHCQCSQKAIKKFPPFISLATSAEDLQNFKFSPPYFEPQEH